MTKIVEFLKKLRLDQRGVSSLEYAILILIVIGVIWAGAGAFEGAISDLFADAASDLNLRAAPGP